MVDDEDIVGDNVGLLVVGDKVGLFKDDFDGASVAGDEVI